MPKTFLSEKDRLSDRLAAWVYSQLDMRRMNQSQLAKEMDITQQALSYKLINRSFSYPDFVTIVAVFNPDPSELAWLVGRKGSI